MFPNALLFCSSATALGAGAMWLEILELTHVAEAIAPHPPGHTGSFTPREVAFENVGAGSARIHQAAQAVWLKC